MPLPRRLPKPHTGAKGRDRFGAGVAVEPPPHTGTTPGPARRSAAPSPAAASPWARGPALLPAPPLFLGNVPGTAPVPVLRVPQG